MTATTSNLLSPAPPLAVAARTNGAGDITAVGHTGTFAPATALHHRRGGLRSLDCDPAAGPGYQQPAFALDAADTVVGSGTARCVLFDGRVTG